MQGGRQTLMPGPIGELRAIFKNVFTSIKPFIPPPTDAIKTGATLSEASPPAVLGADVTRGRGSEIAKWNRNPSVSTEKQ
jgi:hypothetical protein